MPCGDHRRQVDDAVRRDGERRPGPPRAAEQVVAGGDHLDGRPGLPAGDRQRRRARRAGCRRATSMRQPAGPAMMPVGGQCGCGGDRRRRRGALVDLGRPLVEPGREDRGDRRRRCRGSCTAAPSNRRWTGCRPCPGWSRCRRRSAGSSRRRTSARTRPTHIQVIAVVIVWKPWVFAVSASTDATAYSRTNGRPISSPTSAMRNSPRLLSGCSQRSRTSSGTR